MTHRNPNTLWARPLGLALGLLLVGACAKGDKTAQQSADSVARNLTLAPSDSSAALHDVPAATQPQTPPPAATPPRSRPPAPKPRAPAAPAAPATRTADAGSFMDVSVSDTLSSRFTKAGDAFTASVVKDVTDAQGHVVIPSGSVVHGNVVEVKPAPNPSTPGTLTLALTSVTVGGSDYPIEARIDSIETVRQGRGVTGGDAAKVGAGAAAGAILGRVIGKNTKGAVIGGIVGAVAGAGVAVQTKDADVVLPKGAHINATLTQAVTVRS
jgi:Glycine zipper